MLIGLWIRDVVLIEALDLSIGPGLTALTGETGAGKSIILDSLGLAVGARADAGLVRQGSAGAAVSAVFALPADHPDIQAWAAESSLLQLKQSDLDMIRVLEDLISVLITKGVIRITDLPPAAQSKLLSRNQAREALGGISRLIVEEDDEAGSGLI